MQRPDAERPFAAFLDVFLDGHPVSILVEVDDGEEDELFKFAEKSFHVMFYGRGREYVTTFEK